MNEKKARERKANEKKTAVLAKKAAKIVMDDTANACKKAGVTRSRVLKRLNEGLDAHKVESRYDPQTGGWTYSKQLIAHGVRLKAVEIATELLGLRPATKIEFPDENGKPQQIGGGVMTDMERATRLVYLLNQAAKRKKTADGKKRSGKD